MPVGKACQRNNYKPYWVCNKIVPEEMEKQPSYVLTMTDIVSWELVLAIDQKPTRRTAVMGVDIY